MLPLCCVASASIFPAGAPASQTQTHTQTKTHAQTHTHTHAHRHIDTHRHARKLQLVAVTQVLFRRSNGAAELSACPDSASGETRREGVRLSADRLVSWLLVNWLVGCLLASFRRSPTKRRARSKSRARRSLFSWFDSRRRQTLPKSWLNVSEVRRAREIALDAADAEMLMLMLLLLLLPAGAAGCCWLLLVAAGCCCCCCHRCCCCLRSRLLPGVQRRHILGAPVTLAALVLRPRLDFRTRGVAPMPTL